MSDDLKVPFLNMLGVCIENSRAVRNSIIEKQLGGTGREAREIKRLWTVAETCELVGVSHTAIKKREADGSLPAPKLNGSGRVAGYDFYSICQMREVFDRLPYLFSMDENGGTFSRRPFDSTLPAVTICVCGHKGGSYKTTVSVYFAQWLAMMGYKVLLIDADPQATATRYFGYVPDREIKADKTILPFMQGQAESLQYAIHDTQWPNLDLVPSCLGLQAIEHSTENLDLPYEPQLMLRAGIESVADNYDVVIVDGSPNLGRGTLNQVFAGDVIICPTPAELQDYSSTEQFFEAIYGMVSKIDDEDFLQVPDVRVLITKYSYLKSSSSHLMDSEIRKAWGGLVLQNRVQVTEEIGKGQYRSRSIFEQAKSERSSPASWAKANDMFSDLFKEILENLVQPHWAEDEE